MSEPSYVVTCPYCFALVALFEEKDMVYCTACGGYMAIVWPHGKIYVAARQVSEEKKK